MTSASVNTLEQLDDELETILTSFDTNYVWNYGSVKDGLRDLYEKAKRDQVIQVRARPSKKEDRGAPALRKGRAPCFEVLGWGGLQLQCSG